MIAARQFLSFNKKILSRISRIEIEVLGSLAYTFKGHGTDKAIMLGLSGQKPHEVNIDNIKEVINNIKQTKKINLLNSQSIIDFDYEITLLTLTQNNGNTLFCPPVGHRQERGDYQESWQPMTMEEGHLKEAEKIANKVTKALGGSGIWGVEFFIGKDGVYFSELSPRPHDTGMVTLAGTQNFTEFELHARAILGIPVLDIPLVRNGASAVVLADKENSNFPKITGLEEAANFTNTDFKIFGKPITRPYRRMAVALAYGNEEVAELVEKAKEVAAKIKVD